MLGLGPAVVVQVLQISSFRINDATISSRFPSLGLRAKIRTQTETHVKEQPTHFITRRENAELGFENVSILYNLWNKDAN